MEVAAEGNEEQKTGIEIGDNEPIHNLRRDTWFQQKMVK